ncbi:hypothetical protein QQF64_001694 [Cirrhinus molitorella]|uniref:Uncharacterized protein n=1 Tax=Cirrhinus molitorella TaxID=172907 RepID=A0ABR3P244_9TELE
MRGGGLEWRASAKGQDSLSFSLSRSLSGAFKSKLCVLFFKFTLVLVALSSCLHVFISVTREMRTGTHGSVRLEFLTQVILKLCFGS